MGADASTTFSVDIEETGGADAAGQLEALREKILGGSAALREMQAAMRNLKGGTSVDVGAYKALRDQIDATKASVAAAQAQFVNLGGAIDGAAKKADAIKPPAPPAPPMGNAKFGELGGAMGQLGGPLGVVGQKGLMAADALKKLSGSLGLTGAIAVAAAAAIVLVAVAIAAAVVATAAWAVGLADARRNQELATEGLAKSSKELAGVGAAIKSVHAVTGASADSLRKMAEQLSAAGVKAADLPDALRAVSLATEGGASAEAIKRLNDDLKSGKKSARELADEMQATFGGIVAKKMLALDKQGERLKENVSNLFGGLNIEPLLQGIARLVGMLDESSASGRLLKAVFEGLFQPLIDAAGATIPVIEVFLLSLAIAAVKTYIAFKPAIKAVKELFGDTDTSSLPDALSIAAFLGETVATSIMIVIGVLGVLAAVALAPVLAFMQLWSVGAKVGEVIVGAVEDAIQSVMSFAASLYVLGSDMIAGLAEGISGGAARVVEAITGVVGGAISSAKALLGIASPSKVFKGIATNVTDTTADTFDAGAADVAASAGDMMRGAAGAAGAAATPSSSSPSSGSSGNTLNLTINVTAGGGDGQGIAQAVRQAVVEFFEETGFMAGLAPAEAA